MNSFNYTINQAKYEDIEKHLLQCSKLFSPALDTYVSIPDYSKKIRDNAITVEAWYSDELIGLVACYLNNDKTHEGYITNVSIIHAYHGKGIAKKLIKNTIEEALSKNFKTLNLEVEVDNKLAIELYRQSDFVLNGRIGSKYLMINRLLENKDVLVSICCVTYNHVKYLRDAIGSFLMQKTDFPIEILIHDDASTDGTVQIVKEYERKYPEIIKPIFQKENQFSQDRTISAIYQFPRAKGKYIAMCECDDYWTDPYKLQKQVDFMENNSEYSLCTHSVEVIFENDWKWSKDTRLKEPIQIATFTDVVERHFIPTNSILFRREYIKQLPDWFNNMLSGDIPLFWILTSHGKCYHFFEKMGVKRINGGGITANPDRAKRIPQFYADLFYHIDNYTKYHYHKFLFKKTFKSSWGMVKNGIKQFKLSLIIKYCIRIFMAYFRIHI